MIEPRLPTPGEQYLMTKYAFGGMGGMGGGAQQGFNPFDPIIAFIMWLMSSGKKWFGGNSQANNTAATAADKSKPNPDSVPSWTPTKDNPSVNVEPGNLYADPAVAAANKRMLEAGIQPSAEQLRMGRDADVDLSRLGDLFSNPIRPTDDPSLHANVMSTAVGPSAAPSISDTLRTPGLGILNWGRDNSRQPITGVRSAWNALFNRVNPPQQDFVPPPMYRNPVAATRPLPPSITKTPQPAVGPLHSNYSSNWWDTKNANPVLNNTTFGRRPNHSAIANVPTSMKPFNPMFGRLKQPTGGVLNA